MSVVLSAPAINAVMDTSDSSNFVLLGGAAQIPQSSQSAVIRARYEPDVRGVNRYKHFHRPVLFMKEGSACGSAESANPGGSIDSKRNTSKSPRSAASRSPRFRHHDLPSIETNNSAGKTFASARAVFEKPSQNDSNCPPVIETWRIRRRPSPSTRANDPTISPSSITPSRRESVSAGTSPLKSPILPQITPNLGGGDGLLNVVPAPSILNRCPSPSPFITEEVSIITAQQRKEIKQPQQARFYHSTTGNNYEQRKNGFDIEKNLQTSQSLVDTFQKADLSALPIRVGEKIALLNGEFNQPKQLKKNIDIKRSNESYPVKLNKKLQTAELGTQTDLNVKITCRSPQLSHESSTSTDLSLGTLATERTPKATQTDQFAFFNKVNSLCGDSAVEMEQRTELLEIIDNALEETIDRQSRIVANQNIISAARKQAQVWRDAKEFVSSMLLPCSIELANKTRSSKMPYEKIADIQLP